MLYNNTLEIVTQAMRDAGVDKDHPVASEALYEAVAKSIHEVITSKDYQKYICDVINRELQKATRHSGRI